MTTADRLAQRQFLVFEGVGDRIALSDEDRRRVLLLSPPEWSAWSALKSGGPVPPRPALPDMLRRLGAAAYRLERMAERRARAAA
ncbi:MAG TPA: hypothetical protein VFA03_01810 [Acetobacteraceae bacterium]|nr:hypothetical protein [Acetobacteraceae bacterium]